MGFKKILAFPLILLFVSGCVLLSKKAETSLKQTDFPPVPEVIQEKKLVILPFENFSGKIEYDFAAQMIPGELHRFLRFVNTYPFSLETALLANEPAFFEYFGVSAPDARQRKLYLQEALEMLAFKEESDPAKQFKGWPEFFTLKVLPPNEPLTPELLKEKPLFLRGKITETGTILLEIQDSLTGETVLSWPVILPPMNLDWTRGDFDLHQSLYPLLQPFLEKLSGKPFYPVKIQTTPPDLTLYVNSLFVGQKEAYLPQGRHVFKAVKPGFITREGQMEVSNGAVLEVSLEERKARALFHIETIPPGAPVFIDDRYYGPSPVQTRLSPGIHQVRVSKDRYQHSNTVLKISPFEEGERKVVILLEPEQEGQESYRKGINFAKNFAFYSFFPFFGAYIYCQERYESYSEKRQTLYSQYPGQAHLYNYNDIQEKEQFFNLSRQFFRNSSIFLLMSAAILQALELEMDDVGVGVDRDKNLGIYWKF